jgi:hypothetical protein
VSCHVRGKSWDSGVVGFVLRAGMLLWRNGAVGMSADCDLL